MNLMLYKDGRLVMNEQGKPLEGQESDLRNLYAYVTDPADGDTLVYDSTAGMWKVGKGGGSFAPDITDPQDGDTLVYNAAQQKWVNGAGAGGLFIVHGSYNEQDGNYLLDCTTQELLDAIDDGKIIIYSFIMKVNGAIVLAYQGTMTIYSYTPDSSSGEVLLPETYTFAFVANATDMQKDDFSSFMPMSHVYQAHSLDEYPVKQEML